MKATIRMLEVIIAILLIQIRLNKKEITHSMQKDVKKHNIS